MPNISDRMWAQVREQAAQLYAGCSAKQFVENFQNGRYEDWSEERLQILFGFFPELD